MFTKKKLKIIIDENNAIILGTWTGLSSAAGFEYGGKNLYKRLYALVQWKNYFVITTNVDHQFQKNGFDKERLFYIQGNYELFQCSRACHNKTYDNKNYIEEMVKMKFLHI